MKDDAGFGMFVGAAALVVILGLAAAFMFGIPALGRFQAVQNATNEVRINEIRIQQQAQLIEVEKQRKEIRIVEAEGIAESQRIINATLTDRYLQHEAIKAQETMANGPNHTTVYIPSGQNGIPIVRTEDGR